MNIVVMPYGSDRCCCRPDTTWERENKDFYVPEQTDKMHWAPIVFARICKAGKCVGRKFAERYYDAFNFGALLYTGNGETAFTSCADHTSLLPAPLYNTVVMENGDNCYEVLKNGKRIFSTDCKEVKMLIEDAICKASQTISLRIGDFVAAELAPVSMLAGRQENEARFKASFCINELYDIRLIF